MDKLPNFDFERELWREGYEYVAGVDEVGRGCLAGPVAAAAVIFRENQQLIEGVNDSKKLNPKKRERLFELIVNKCVAWSFGTASVKEIDQNGIVGAVEKAMMRALSGLVKVDYVIIDGPKIPDRVKVGAKSLIGGDQKCFSVSAASIVAKVMRDQMMISLGLMEPRYRFEKHKGYGTRAHRAAIVQYGLSYWHRPTFINDNGK